MKPVMRLFVSGVVGLLTLVLAGTASAASSGGGSACKAASNIEAIIDDSGSMTATDPDRLRVQGMDLLINDLAGGTRLGAVEFGSGFEIPGYLSDPAAETVFAPEPVGPNAATMRSALDAAIQGDAGATDYNAAFAKADADNPTADARVFLTDGGHNTDTYNEAHLAHRVPTYVIGFGTEITSSSGDTARLKKIAKDTGGRYNPVEDTSELQAAMNSIGSALTCQTPPRTFVDQLQQGQSKPHSLTVAPSTRRIQVTLTWANPGDRFKLTGLRLTQPHKGVVAVSARPKHRKPRKLKVTQKNSSTFTILRVSGLAKGKLHFKVKAIKLGSGSGKASLTTQVGPLGDKHGKGKHHKKHRGKKHR